MNHSLLLPFFLKHFKTTFRPQSKEANFHTYKATTLLFPITSPYKVFKHVLSAITSDIRQRVANCLKYETKVN
jgi:hypothetical protein